MTGAGELWNLSAVELDARVRSGDVSPVETVTASLERIEALNLTLNAFVHLCPEHARALETRLVRR